MAHARCVCDVGAAAAAQLLGDTDAPVSWQQQPKDGDIAAVGQYNVLLEDGIITWHVDHP